MDGTGGNSLLPPEGINAAANLFSLIAESELRGNNIALYISEFVAFIMLSFFCNTFPNSLACVLVASASAMDDNDEADYLQASISGTIKSSMSYM